MYIWEVSKRSFISNDIAKEVVLEETDILEYLKFLKSINGEYDSSYKIAFNYRLEALEGITDV
jgi:hypothetical protein